MCRDKKETRKETYNIVREKIEKHTNIHWQEKKMKSLINL